MAEKEKQIQQKEVQLQQALEAMAAAEGLAMEAERREKIAQFAADSSLATASRAMDKVSNTEDEMRTLLKMMEQKRMVAEGSMRQLQDSLAHLQRTSGLSPSPF